MRILILITLFLFFFALLSAEIRGKVVGVSDGDTITVLDELDQGTFRIRLDKIDALNDRPIKTRKRQAT
jgi:endonuclease YncB( thermonuclease family)